MMESFETERLLMRPLSAKDQALYCACYTDPLLMQHIGEPLTEEAALRSFTTTMKISAGFPPRGFTWAMQEKPTGIAVGLLAMVCDKAEPAPVTAELGTIMLSNFQNRGYTSEALRELADTVFSLTSLTALFVKHKSQNSAVTGVMTKLGYVADTLTQGPEDGCQWVLRRDHWQTASLRN